MIRPNIVFYMKRISIRCDDDDDDDDRILWGCVFIVGLRRQAEKRIANYDYG